MRKFRLLSLLLLATSFIFVNCTKEGPEGPVGATGAQGPVGNTGATGAAGAQGPTGVIGPVGPQGPQGPVGSANVIYSAWFQLNLTSATPFDTTVHLKGFVTRAYLAAPSLTQAILDNGIVLSYFRITDPTVATYPLPYNFSFGGPGAPNSYEMSSISTVGKLIFICANTSNNTTVLTLNGRSFRYVIIPGAVAGGRGAGPIEKMGIINGQTYTESQLKTMSYSQISTLLGLQP